LRQDIIGQENIGPTPSMHPLETSKQQQQQGQDTAAATTVTSMGDEGDHTQLVLSLSRLSSSVNACNNSTAAATAPVYALRSGTTQAGGSGTSHAGGSDGQNSFLLQPLDMKHTCGRGVQEGNEIGSIGGAPYAAWPPTSNTHHTRHHPNMAPLPWTSSVPGIVHDENSQASLTAAPVTAAAAAPWQGPVTRRRSSTTTAFAHVTDAGCGSAPFTAQPHSAAAAATGVAAACDPDMDIETAHAPPPQHCHRRQQQQQQHAGPSALPSEVCEQGVCRLDSGLLRAVQAIMPRPGTSVLLAGKHCCCCGLLRA
jgi:hypothetical protein